MFKSRERSTAWPKKNFEIELYSNQSCNADESGSASADAYGEGQNYLTTLYLTTNNGGNGSFNTTLPYNTLGGDFLTALASNVTPGNTEEGNTSEFSACREVVKCTALNGEVNQAILSPVRLQVGDKLYFGSASTTANAGHVRAYSVGNDGKPTSSALWDGAAEMTAIERSSHLFSTSTASGTNNVVTLANLDADAFNTNGEPNKDTIVEYTVDPGYDNGIYRDDRAVGSLLGNISSGTNMALISNKLDPWFYLQDPTYRTYVSDVVSQRTEHLLVTSTDGFIYALDTSNGDLGWGWIPRTLVGELVDYQTFRDKNWMRGHIEVLDLKSTTGYETYVLGSYRGGIGQYVLKLDSTSSSKSDLASVVWDIDEQALSNTIDSAPGNGKRAYFTDGNNKTYMAYIVSADSTSYLKIRSVTDASVSLSIQLNYTVNSVPFVMPDFANVNAPASKTLYLGDSNGNIHAANLLISGALSSDTSISSSLNGPAVAIAASDVTFIGASVSADGGYYLRVQSRDRLTVFKYLAAQWKRQWTAFVGGAGKWGSDNAYASDSGIQALPSGALIDDEATIIADSIVLPVSTQPTGTNCYRNAFYYLYDLGSGAFPAKRFFHTDDTEITTIITLGNGSANKLEISDFSGEKLMGYGLSAQTTSSNVGLNSAFYIKDLMTVGIRSWRELR